MKLIAITNVKYGTKGETAAPGETFSADDKMAAGLITAGAAATPEDYERAKAAAMPADERMAQLEVENAQLRAANTEMTAKLSADKGKTKD